MGIDAKGMASICKAKPENVGKGNCHHVEHVTIKADSMKTANEQVEQYNSKHYEQSSRKLKHVSVDEAYASNTGKGLRAKTKRAIDLEAAQLENKALRRYAEEQAALDAIIIKSNTARPIDVVLRDEANRRLKAINDKTALVDAAMSSGSFEDKAAALQGQSVNLKRYVNPSFVKRNPDFSKALASWGASDKKIVGQQDGKMIYIGPDGRRFYADADAFNVDGMIADYDARLHKTADLMNLKAKAFDLHSNKRFTAVSMLTLEGSGIIAPKMLRAHREDIKKAVQESRELDDTINRRKKEVAAYHDLSVKANDAVHAYHASRNDLIDGRKTLLEQEKTATFVKEGHDAVSDDIRKHFKEALGKTDWPYPTFETNVIANNHDGGYIVRQHTDQWYHMSDDARSFQRGDTAFTTILTTDYKILTGKRTGKPLKLDVTVSHDNSGPSEPVRDLENDTRANAPAETMGIMDRLRVL
jgi:hypothetical protein